MDLTVWTSVGLFVLPALGTLLALSLREYFSGFGRRAGEIAAEHKKLQTIVAQLEATTAAAKRVETQFNATLWLEQQKWPLKRETYQLMIEHVRSLIWFLHQTREMAVTHEPDDLVDDRQAKELERTMHWMVNIGDVGELRTTATTLGMDRAISILDRVVPLLGAVTSAETPIDPNTIEAVLPQLVAAYRDLLAASRDDLGNLVAAATRASESATKP